MPKRSKPKTAKPKPRAAVKARAITPGDWPTIETLFGKNGACAGCWCMYWRTLKGGAYWQARKGEPNRKAFKTLVTGGDAPGVLAFAGDAPVGWCSVAPKADFAYFGRSRVLNVASPPGTWSVTCFYVSAKWRGKGVASALLREAVALAKRSGATTVEGYPAASSSSGKMADVFAWTGLPPLFAKAGFTKLKRAPGLRPIYRCTV